MPSSGPTILNEVVFVGPNDICVFFHKVLIFLTLQVGEDLSQEIDKRFDIFERTLKHQDEVCIQRI